MWTREDRDHADRCLPVVLRVRAMQNCVASARRRLLRVLLVRHTEMSAVAGRAWLLLLGLTCFSRSLLKPFTRTSRPVGAVDQVIMNTAKKMRILLVAAWAVSASVAMSAGGERASDVQITNAWARPTVPGQAVGAAYFDVRSTQGATVAMRRLCRRGSRSRAIRAAAAEGTSGRHQGDRAARHAGRRAWDGG
jgi:hypothetical protein